VQAAFIDGGLPPEYEDALQLWRRIVDYQITCKV
jgi:hypothetical protein